jgi:acetyl esterase
LKGEWDPAQKAALEGMYAAMPKDPDGEVHNNMNEAEIEIIRGIMKTNFAQYNIMGKAMLDMCDTEVVKFAPKQFGSDCEEELEIHIHRSKTAAPGKKRALIYFHGGGAVTQDPEQYYMQTVAFCLYADITVFSCQYRLGPETKCPGGILDAYAAIKYITSSADKFNIDSNRVGLYGISGGGWILTGATYELAKRNEGHLVKLVYLDTPQLFGDFWFNDNFDFTWAESHHRKFNLGTFEMLTGSKTKTPNDPYQYAPCMSSDLMAKLPMHFFISQEFDFFRRDTLFYIGELNKHNKVVDILCQPGGTHVSQNSKEDQILFFSYL